MGGINGIEEEGGARGRKNKRRVRPGGTGERKTHNSRSSRLEAPRALDIDKRVHRSSGTGEAVVSPGTCYVRNVSLIKEKMNRSIACHLRSPFRKQ